MAAPEFDYSTGWWYIRYRMSAGTRAKKTLLRDPRWTKGGDWPPVDRKTGRRRKPNPPAEVLLLARPYQDADLAVKHGREVELPRTTDLAAYCRLYQEEHAAGHAANTARVLRQSLAHFLAYCEGRRVKTLEAVTVAFCREYLVARYRTAARGTLKSEKGVLMPIWSRAMHDRLVSENPWKLAPVPGRDEHEAPHFWTPAEVAMLIGACDGYLRDLVTVGVNCGLRITSLLTLRWDDVDFGRGAIVVRAGAAKAGRRHEVPMNEESRPVLERRQMTAKGDLVFPSPRTARAMKAVVTWKAIGRAVKRAGIPDHGHYNHALRHSFASNAIIAGVPLVVVSKWLGHASIATTMKYAHLAPSESSRQMERFSLGGPAPPDAPSPNAPRPRG